MMVPQFLQKGQNSSPGRHLITETATAKLDYVESPISVDKSAGSGEDNQLGDSPTDDKSDRVDNDGQEKDSVCREEEFRSISQEDVGYTCQEEDSVNENDDKLSDEVHDDVSTADDRTKSEEADKRTGQNLNSQISVESSDCSVEDFSESCRIREGAVPDSEEEELMREIDDMIEACSSQLSRRLEEEEDDDDSSECSQEDVSENSSQNEKLDNRIAMAQRSISQDSSVSEDERCFRSGQNGEKQSRRANYNSNSRAITMSQSLSLAQYAQSKRKMSSCSVESNASKHLSDSDSGSVFSPDDSESPKFFPGNELSSKSGKSVSWSSEVKSPSHSKSPLCAIKKPFNPFPVRHFNENRAKTGIKLGMYKTSTFDNLEKQSKRRTLWSK
jgi:hypothetical protein